MRSIWKRGGPGAARLLIAGVLTLTSSGALGQEKEPGVPTRERLIEAARGVMGAARYCALITVDETGMPRARVMDPFPPDTGMVVWLGTNSKSRKVRQIGNDPRVVLYYFDPEGLSYVTITGRARIVDDPVEESRRWKDEWERIYADRRKGYLLIQVTPDRLEVLSPKEGINADPETWEPPSVQFDSRGAED